MVGQNQAKLGNLAKKQHTQIKEIIVFVNRYLKKDLPNLSKNDFNLKE